MFESLGFPEDFWLFNMLGNVSTYLILVVPAYFIISYLQKNPFLIWENKIGDAIRLCVLGDEELPSEIDAKKALEAKVGGKAEEESMTVQGVKLLLTALGLQGSYLAWGVLQENIMTQSYGIEEDGSEARFKTSQFLIFVNRVTALVISFIITRFCSEQPKHVAPLFKYSFTSMSNIMSSFFQLEALKYVSFPTQVLAKASKVIPVMIMGKFVQGTTYPAWEYGIACCLSLGVAVFMFSKAEEDGKAPDEDKTTSFSGIICLCGYMVFDSFTSNYQSSLFKTYKMSKFQMMFGINLFSCIFTCWSLVLQGEFWGPIAFAMRWPTFMWHIGLNSCTSATGQLFIFHTISTYGPLIFTIIMTTRQIASIILSAFIFGHHFNLQGWCGVGIVGMTLFGKVYLSQQAKKAKMLEAARGNDATGK